MLALHRKLFALRQSELAPRLRGMPGAGEVLWRDRMAMALGWTLGDTSYLTLVTNMSAKQAQAPSIEVRGSLLHATGGYQHQSPIERLPAWTAAFYLDKA